MATTSTTLVLVLISLKSANEPNQELLSLRRRIVDAVRPDIAPDCDFVASDLGQPFKAHITLAFRDIQPAMQANVLAYLHDTPLPDKPFLADTFHFLEFFSQDWPGSWEKSLSWRLHKTWRLSDKA